MIRLRHARRGFTLIELLAVVVMIALVAGLVLPRMGLGGEERTMSEAKQLAASLELARQRAAVTGTPHRLLLDLDRQGYRLEWLAPEDADLPPDEAPEAASHPADQDWSQVEQLPMAPPEEAARAWRALPAPIGDPSWLPDGIAVLTVETPGLRSREGRVFATFGPDGSGEATAIELGDERGNRVTLEIAPLADRVSLAWGGLDDVRGRGVR